MRRNERKKIFKNSSKIKSAKKWSERAERAKSSCPQIEKSDDKLKRKFRSSELLKCSPWWPSSLSCYCTFSTTKLWTSEIIRKKSLPLRYILKRTSAQCECQNKVIGNDSKTKKAEQDWKYLQFIGTIWANQTLN